MSSSLNILIKKKPLKSGFYESRKISYFLILPSPSMIHRAEKADESSSLKAYLGSIFFMRPDNH